MLKEKSGFDIKSSKISRTYLRDHELVFITEHTCADQVYEAYKDFELMKKEMKILEIEFFPEDDDDDDDDDDE